MKTKEEVADFLRKTLEEYIKTFTESPGGYEILKPEYYQKRLEHFDEILPIYMAGEIRRQLEKISKYSNWDELKKGLKSDPQTWITINDLERKGVFDPTNPNMKPDIAIYGKVESLLGEFMNELGESIPNFDKNTSMTKEEEEIFDAKRGINALGVYGIPRIIPSEMEKSKLLTIVTNESTERLKWID